MTTSKNTPEQQDMLTLSPADFPARTLAKQESGAELTAKSQDYGQSSAVLLARYDPDMPCWRTSQRCLVEGWAVLRETWPRSGMTVNGIAYQLPPLVRLTGGTGSGLLPTPDVRGFTNDGSLMMLKKHVTREEWDGMAYRKGRKAKEKLWPTPNASDHRDRGNMSNPSIQRRQILGKQLNLSMVVSETSGQLNPTWVAALMGFPVGWVRHCGRGLRLCRESKSSRNPASGVERRCSEGGMVRDWRTWAHGRDGSSVRFPARIPATI